MCSRMPSFSSFVEVMFACWHTIVYAADNTALAGVQGTLASTSVKSASSTKALAKNTSATKASVGATGASLDQFLFFSISTLPGASYTTIVVNTPLTKVMVSLQTGVNIAWLEASSSRLLPAPWIPTSQGTAPNRARVSMRVPDGYMARDHGPSLRRLLGPRPHRLSPCHTCSHRRRPVTQIRPASGHPRSRPPTRRLYHPQRLTMMGHVPMVDYQ